MDTIGKYTIQEVIGRGGMGTVYRARDTVIGREVAIKVIAEHVASIPNVKERFYQEAISAGRLTHEHIMTIYDVGENDGRPFLVMELLDGRDLRSMFDSGDAPGLERKLEIAIQISRGLAYAHARGVVHRDIKPENVRILSTGRLKILDFGIARVESETRTMTHSSIGTPRYMSPEQVRGKQIDHRTDIFSFGVLLYELLSGVNPFDGSHVTAVIYKILHEEPEPVKVDDERLSADLQRIVAGCLEKDVDKRYPDFTAVIHDLEDVLSKRQSDASTLLDDRRSSYHPDEGPARASLPAEIDVRQTERGGWSASRMSGGEKADTPGAPATVSASRPRRTLQRVAVIAAVLVVLSAVSYFVVNADLFEEETSGPVLPTAADIPVSDETAALYQEVVQLRNEMVVEKRNAEPWSDTEALAELYQEALEQERTAIMALQEKTDSSYQRAADAFHAAKSGFYAVSVAGQNDESTMRAEAEASRLAADRARRLVYDRRDSPLISDAFGRAEAAAQRGSEQFEAGEYTDALVSFGAAQAGFRDMERTLARSTALEATRRRAETARQAMDETRIRIAQWRDAPGNIELYREADEIRREGLRFADAGRYEDAFTYFERADAAFARVREPVQPDEPDEPLASAGASAAEQARADMEASKARVSEALHQHEQYVEAARIEESARNALGSRSFDSAAELFGRADERYAAVAALPLPKTAEEQARGALVPLLNQFEKGLEEKDAEGLRRLHTFLGAYSAMFDVADEIRADISHTNLNVSNGRATASVSVDLSYRNTTQRMRQENQSVNLLWTLEEAADGQWHLREVARQ